MSVVKQIFQRQIDLLQKQALAEKDFMPEISNALQFKSPKDYNEKERVKERDSYLQYMIKNYIQENGCNAYALLNVLTDYASRPRYTMTSLENNSDSLERRVGMWMTKYLSKEETRFVTNG